MLDRIFRAIRLDSTVFREIAKDQNAMTEAAIIVVVVTILSSIGRAFASDSFIVSFIVNLLLGILVNWIGWAILTHFVGALLFKGDSDISEMMRVLGYANAPRLLGILAIIPCLRWIAALVGAILALIAGFIAVREAMDLDTDKAILTVLISWVVALAIDLVIGGGMALVPGL